MKAVTLCIILFLSIVPSDAHQSKSRRGNDFILQADPQTKHSSLEDLYEVNSAGGLVILPESTNPAGQRIVINQPTTIKHVGTNPHITIIEANAPACLERHIPAPDEANLRVVGPYVNYITWINRIPALSQEASDLLRDPQPVEKGYIFGRHYHGVYLPPPPPPSVPVGECAWPPSIPQYDEASVLQQVLKRHEGQPDREDIGGSSNIHAVLDSDSKNGQLIVLKTQGKITNVQSNPGLTTVLNFATKGGPIRVTRRLPIRKGSVLQIFDYGVGESKIVFEPTPPPLPVEMAEFGQAFGRMMGLAKSSFIETASRDLDIKRLLRQLEYSRGNIRRALAK